MAGAWRCTYNIQKYFVAPDFMPEHVVQVKAYVTWIFGFSLLVPVDLKPKVYLIGASVMNIDAADAGVRRIGTLGAYPRP